MYVYPQRLELFAAARIGQHYVGAALVRDYW